jgi:hypothetical protein
VNHDGIRTPRGRSPGTSSACSTGHRAYRRSGSSRLSFET